jgi:hypothetical protein
LTDAKTVPDRTPEIKWGPAARRAGAERVPGNPEACSDSIKREVQVSGEPIPRPARMNGGWVLFD